MSVDMEDTNEKPRCFVMMPISNQTDYLDNHFDRVYKHIIKPAIQLAGFEPIRSDDDKHSDVILIDILNNIQTCEIAICDLSSKNANVMYELGIRHSFNLPVTLIKDEKTNRVFDIQGIRFTEYDSKLRVDDVEKSIIEISESLKQTFKLDREQPNSILKLMKIKKANVGEITEITNETQLILDSINDIGLRIRKVEEDSISKLDDDSEELLDKYFASKYPIGKIVMHTTFGRGTVITRKKNIITIAFNSRGIKKINLNFGNHFFSDEIDDSDSKCTEQEQ